jgi:hypothetical protein
VLIDAKSIACSPMFLITENRAGFHEVGKAIIN